MTWDSSGIVMGQGVGGIVRCSPNGGAPQRLATVNEGELAQSPQALLDGAALLFTIAKVADGPSRWKGAELFYVPTVASGKLAAVSVATQPSPVFGSPVSLPRELLRAGSRARRGRTTFCRTADSSARSGRRSRNPPALFSGQMRVVLNWFEELKQRVPPPR